MPVAGKKTITGCAVNLNHPFQFITLMLSTIIIVKSIKLGWDVYMARIVRRNNVYSFFFEEPLSKMLVLRLKRCEFKVKNDLYDLKYTMHSEYN